MLAHGKNSRILRYMPISENISLSINGNMKIRNKHEKEETGHFPMLEKPEEFNMLLEKALNSIESESSKNI